MLPIALKSDRVPSWFRPALVAVLATLLVACASPQLRYSQLVVLNKGMAPAQTIAVLQQPPITVQVVEQAGKAYTFHRYQLYNGLYSDVYLLCFEQGKLKYWGYVEEFRRYPDPAINQAVELALDKIIDSETR
ncbi:hypothetical protein ED236_02875 [Pseudomethylobacillus aquaticus]|uniref:Uncharacterized protein n=1 Tax=Pseudomethylobacillus aquaticus TaxID=2676064 RepID=A0A3N0V6S5_9PROT|nr:hypothetical protein [Pseudomethylobacillus aquaticus]ROH88413.1 hypothetical protein ED236_02875 [Pseudomethylobacillus aquaticus]